MGAVHSRADAYSTAVSLKPSGFSSKTDGKGRSYMKPTESSAHKYAHSRGLPDSYKPHVPDPTSVPWPEVPRTALLPGEDLKRPAAYRIAHLAEQEQSDRPPCRGGESNGLRPPSRHKPSPKAVGLELPPRPVTPPDTSIDSFFDKTWSFAKRPEEEQVEEPRGEKGTTYAVRDNGRPKSQKKLLGSLEKSDSLFAWDDRSKVRTSAEKPLNKKGEPLDVLKPSPDKYSQREIPITVTKTGIPIDNSDFVFIRRRLQTAEVSAPKGWTPKLMGNKGGGTSGRVRDSAEGNFVRGSHEGEYFGYFD